jgi:hypothetical protein
VRGLMWNGAVWLAAGLVLFQTLAAGTCCCFLKKALDCTPPDAGNASWKGSCFAASKDAGCTCSETCICKRLRSPSFAPAGRVIGQNGSVVQHVHAYGLSAILCQDGRASCVSFSPVPLPPSVSSSQRCAILCRLHL